MNVFLFYDSNSTIRNFKEIDSFNRYFTKFYNNTIDVRFYSPKLEPLLNQSGLDFSLGEENEENDDITFYDYQIEGPIEENNANDLAKIQIKFKFIQKINRKMKNFVYFYLNIYLLNLNDNYLKQAKNINKIIRLNNGDTKIAKSDIYNETECKIHSKFQNQHLFLFLSNSKLVNFFTELWTDVPIFLAEAKSFQQV